MKPAPFEYHRPASVDEAVELLAELGDGAKVLAGGQSLVPMLALRLAISTTWSTSAGSTSCAASSAATGRCWIGAGTTEADVERDPEVAEAVPLLARATPFIGHFQIRNRGTVGGSIAHADPAAEYPAVALALDAELEVHVAARAAHLPPSTSSPGCGPPPSSRDEVLVGVRFPVWTGRCGFAVEEFARRHGDFAIAGAAVAVEIDDDDGVVALRHRADRARVDPVRATAAEAAVVGSSAADVDADEVGRLAVPT